jgi:prepilin-type N-terminal cleavage/methylation domain-containing protein
MRSPRQWLSDRFQSDEAGMTLTEVMVGMVIMTIFGSIFTTSIVSMFSSSNKVQAAENSSAQLNTAFDRLDKQVRYASFIEPVQAVSLPTVAFQTYKAATGNTACTLLTIRAVGATMQLAERTWDVADGSATPTNPSGWAQLALGVTANSTFTVGSPTATSGTVVQQLKLHLQATDGNGQAMTSSYSDITFSALNSAAAVSSPPASVCASSQGQLP